MLKNDVSLHLKEKISTPLIVVGSIWRILGIVQLEIWFQEMYIRFMVEIFRMMFLIDMNIEHKSVYKWEILFWTWKDLKLCLRIFWDVYFIQTKKQSNCINNLY